MEHIDPRLLQSSTESSPQHKHVTYGRRHTDSNPPRPDNGNCPGELDCHELPRVKQAAMHDRFHQGKNGAFRCKFCAEAIFFQTEDELKAHALKTHWNEVATLYVTKLNRPADFVGKTQRQERAEQWIDAMDIEWLKKPLRANTTTWYVGKNPHKPNTTTRHAKEKEYIVPELWAANIYAEDNAKENITWPRIGN